MHRYVLAFALSFAINSEAAGVYDGTDLHNELQAYARIERGNQQQGDYQLSAHALGYVQALGDLMSSQGTACPSNSIKAAQMVALVDKFLADHPGQWNEPAFMAVGEALNTAFPCGKNPGEPAATIRK